MKQFGWRSSRKGKHISAGKTRTPRTPASFRAPSARKLREMQASVATHGSSSRPSSNAQSSTSTRAQSFSLPLLGAHQKGASIAWISIGIVLLVLYLAGVIVFSNLFFPRSRIAFIDASLKSDKQLEQALTDAFDAYEIELTGEGLHDKITTHDMNLHIDAVNIVKEMHHRQVAWIWPVALIAGHHDYSSLLQTNADKDALTQVVANKLKPYNKTKRLPRNAYIAFNAQQQKFHIEKEQLGTALDTSRVVQKILAALDELSRSATVDASDAIAPEITETNEALRNTCNQANTMISREIVLTSNGKPFYTVSRKLQGEMIIFKDNGIQFSDEKARRALRGVLAGFNTVGATRTYTRPDGKRVTVRGGSYGWRVDVDKVVEDVIARIKDASGEPLEIPFASTGARALTSDHPDWGSRYIDVDLTEQYARFYDNGSIVWEAPIVSGLPGEHATPTGAYQVNFRTSPQLLESWKNGIRQWSVTVRYWMSFVKNSIGFHDATWQPRFGGTWYKSHGSHGCINLSLDKASALFQIIRKGDPVIVHY